MTSQESRIAVEVLQGACEGASFLTPRGHVCLAPAHAQAVADFIMVLTGATTQKPGAWSVERFDPQQGEPVALLHKGMVTATADEKQAARLEAVAAALNATDTMGALLTEAGAPGGLSAERFKSWRLEALRAAGESAAQVIKAA